MIIIFTILKGNLTEVTGLTSLEAKLLFKKFPYVVDTLQMQIIVYQRFKYLDSLMSPF